MSQSSGAALLNRWVIMRPHRICCCFFAAFTSFNGGPVESMGHNVQNMLPAAFVIVINTMFKAGPFREGHNVFPQSMLLAAILTRFKGGHIESTGHNVFPQMMLFFFQFLSSARTHTSQGDECSGARPLRDSYGTLTGPFGPIRIQTNANSCNSI